MAEFNDNKRKQSICFLAFFFSLFLIQSDSHSTTVSSLVRARPPGGARRPQPRMELIAGRLELLMSFYSASCVNHD